MLFNSKKWIIAGLVILPAHAMATVTVTTASFKDISNTVYIDSGSDEAAIGTDYDNVSDSNIPHYIYNQFDVQSGSYTITVSAWSDTNNGNNDGVGDNTIERAIDFDPNDNGWSIENRDEGQGTSSPQHSADNIGSGDWVDYDFYLLDFGTDVVLSEVYSSWSYDSSDTQVSFAALNSNVSSNLTGNTFASLIASSQATGSSSFTTSKSTINFNNDSSRNNYYADVNLGNNISSSLWVVSAYNTLFGTVSGGGTNNDGFKLAGVSFSQSSGGSTPVPEPTTIAVFGLSLLGFALNRRKKL